MNMTRTEEGREPRNISVEEFCAIGAQDTTAIWEEEERPRGSAKMLGLVLFWFGVVVLIVGWRVIG